MIQNNYDTVSEAVNDLQKQGYTIDFEMLAEKECLICHTTSTELSPEDFEIDHFYRFEGDSDPGDEMIVYAISSEKNNVKGIVINAFGPYADAATSSIVKKLHTHHSK
ncbi:phosphoribosylpyrophosphate synthetase [uncultured Cytophaga sp.]|uniref:phosphoribosylpyrophosphate synthetase n=1 Tax=uncultured Cytophaga sp. TaxID=160238 RepID=UPI00260DD458|nr:phosphoribosylpyrophosphate synthetase [uncultured Cytophaga sp.]